RRSGRPEYLQGLPLPDAPRTVRTCRADSLINGTIRHDNWKAEACEMEALPGAIQERVATKASPKSSLELLSDRDDVDRQPLHVTSVSSKEFEVCPPGRAIPSRSSPIHCRLTAIAGRHASPSKALCWRI